MFFYYIYKNIKYWYISIIEGIYFNCRYCLFIRIVLFMLVVIVWVSNVVFVFLCYIILLYVKKVLFFLM